MSSRTRSLHPWLGAVALAVLSAGPAGAQPPSPLELVRGLRENGQGDLALEYLKDLEAAPLSPDDRAAVLLERAKCLLDASEDEPDEGTRLGMIAQAKEGLGAFVTAHPNHPRAVEGLLSVAKLTSLDAKEVLSRARRMEIPPPSDNAAEKKAREQAQKKQTAEGLKAQPLFKLASNQFTAASKRLRERLEDKGLDPATRRALDRQAFEAELAGGINQFSIAETYLPLDILSGDLRKERNGFLEQAKAVFARLGRGPATDRAAWVARAWVAEVMYEQDDSKTADDEVAAILRAGAVEAEDGKRLARFFKLRRAMKAALLEPTPGKIAASAAEIRGWLGQYGGGRKPTPEVFAANYYLARLLHVQADALSPPPKPPAALVLGETARRQYDEAERLYRKLAQSDHEFTARAARHRVTVVRKLLGDADQNPLTYATFEKAQMASLIQLGKLNAAEDKEAQLQDEDPDPKALDAARAEVRAARERVITLLERARALAAPQDSPGDVTDVHLRLIYFYQQNEQFYQAAVLGDFVARTVKSTGGKSAVAGLLGLGGYITASRAAKGDTPDAVAAARLADRDRAVALARFLDEKYPNDNATDAARYRLASLLADEKKFAEACDVLVRVRPGYAQLTSARLLQGYVVSQLVTPLNSKLSKEDKARLYRRATGDLRKVPRPAAVADEDEVRGYLSARCRLAAMLLAQERADPDTERTNAGFNQALDLSGLVLAEVPAFESMAGKDKKLTLDGMEFNFLALDTYTRAVYLRARAMTNNNQFDGALALIKPTLDLVQSGGPLMTPELRGWAGNAASVNPKDKQKARIAQLAAGVDKNRVDVILAGFRTQVRQGKPGDAAKMLDLMVKAGGTIEESLPLLEPVGQELAALMVTRQKEGKAEEAKNLGAGLGLLLDKIRTVNDLSVPRLLFIGQTLQAVGKNAEALETLKKVRAPAYKDWEKKKPDEVPQEDRGRFQNEVRNYALAQHAIAQALTASKRFAEAEKLLKEILGDSAKPGWGSGRLYFRKALAEMYEAKGAAEPDPKKARGEWGLAVREWSTLFNMQKGRLTALPKDTNPEQLVEYKNAFADAYFDVQRCGVEASKHLLRDPAQGAQLQKAYDDAGKRCADMEKQLPAADWHPDVRNRYHELLRAHPPVQNAYKAAGGKLFLDKAGPAQ